MTTKTACEGCGAAILWTVTASGKPIPVEPPILIVAPDGGFGPLFGYDETELTTVITADGLVARGHVQLGKVEASGDEIAGRVPHHATCPAADQFRVR